MTERGAATLRRSADEISVGPSSLSWDGRGLDISIEEICAPLPRRVVGEMRLDVEALNARSFGLEAEGGHVWRPIAPLARVSVRMKRPALAWQGSAYFDSNLGDEPLEAGFRRWTWSRARIGDGVRVFYEAERRRTGPLALSLAFRRDGTVEERQAPPRAALPRTLWRLPRETRSERGARILETLEDAPFYARSRVRHRLEGEDAVSIHESLDLDRFALPIVKAMLPFRMPRVGRS